MTMYTANLRKVGGSVMLAVPPAILEMLPSRHFGNAANGIGVIGKHGRGIRASDY